jgi:ABC-type lipoprotein release transport system permease subunit
VGFPNVSPTHLSTYACTAVVFLTVALLACLFPALRATRVQRMSILRDE